MESEGPEVSQGLERSHEKIEIIKPLETSNNQYETEETKSERPSSSPLKNLLLPGLI